VLQRIQHCSQLELAGVESLHRDQRSALALSRVILGNAS
jgi:hypothetical protein